MHAPWIAGSEFSTDTHTPYHMFPLFCHVKRLHLRQYFLLRKNKIIVSNVDGDERCEGRTLKLAVVVVLVLLVYGGGS